MCPSVSGPKARKQRVRDLPYSFSVKSYRTFSKKDLKNMAFSYKNRSYWKNITLRKQPSFFAPGPSGKKEKNSQTPFCCLCVYLPTVKIWGNRPNSLWVWAVRFNWKNWFEKTAVNMSIRRVIFTSGQSFKTAISLPIFNLFQWILFYIRDFLWIITLTEKSKFEKNCRSEGILSP